MSQVQQGGQTSTILCGSQTFKNDGGDLGLNALHDLHECGLSTHSIRGRDGDAFIVPAEFYHYSHIFGLA